MEPDEIPAAMVEAAKDATRDLFGQSMSGNIWRGAEEEILDGLMRSGIAAALSVCEVQVVHGIRWRYLDGSPLGELIGDPDPEWAQSTMRRWRRKPESEQLARPALLRRLVFTTPAEEVPDGD